MLAYFLDRNESAYILIINGEVMLKITSVSGRLALAIAGSLLSAHTFAVQCQNPTPVWADEFNGSTLDTSKWHIMTGDGCSYGICGWGNNELQSYQAANLTVSNGSLKITAKKQRVQSKAYTSARIRTANMPASGEWTHGRFEARIKLPTGSGMWPAFWMLPTDPAVGWPMSGEIDIMEATGQADMFVFGTLHYGQAYPNNQWTSNRMLKQPDAWSDDFHVYAIEWEPNEIRWYVDDVLYSVKRPEDLSEQSYWTFEQYQYHLILNLAVGGNLGGPVDDSKLPQVMEVDYVRVYDVGQPALQGPHLVEPGSVATYQVIGQGAGASYSWSSPTGQTSQNASFTVNWQQSGGPVNVAVADACGSHNLSVPVHVAPAMALNTMLDDFDSNRRLSYSTISGSLNPQAANPSADAINNSVLVAQYQRDGGSLYDVIVAQTTAIADAGPYIRGENAVYLDIYTAAPVGTELLVQFENANTATSSNYPTGRHSKYIAHTKVQNAWQRLKFTLEDRIDGATTDNQVNSLVLLIAPNTNDGNVYYLDNISLHSAAAAPGGDEATSIRVASVSSSTVGVGKGQKKGSATVTVLDNLGQPAAGVAVSGQFSGSWNESAQGVTDSAGTVVLQTSSALSGSVTVAFCVATANGSLPHDTAQSAGLCP